MKKESLLIIIAQVFLIACNDTNEVPVSFSVATTGGQVNSDTTDPGNTTTAPIHFDPNCIPDPNSEELTVDIRPQEAHFWCWAACSEMVMEKLGDAIDQCEEANRRFGREDCCNSRFSVNCDRGGWPRFAKHGYTFERTDDEALSWEIVKQQISCRKVPFCMSWRWVEGGGHMMIISAYKTIEGEDMVKIIDPLPIGTGTVRWISYSEYVEGPGYTHWDDFYNVAKPSRN